MVTSGCRSRDVLYPSRIMKATFTFRVITPIDTPSSAAGLRLCIDLVEVDGIEPAAPANRQATLPTELHLQTRFKNGVDILSVLKARDSYRATQGQALCSRFGGFLLHRAPYFIGFSTG